MTIAVLRRTIDQLKRDAKRMHKDTGKQHSECLDILAKQRGFKNWSLLMKSRSE